MHCLQGRSAGDSAFSSPVSPSLIGQGGWTQQQYSNTGLSQQRKSHSKTDPVLTSSDSSHPVQPAHVSSGASLSQSHTHTPSLSLSGLTSSNQSWSSPSTPSSGAGDQGNTERGFSSLERQIFGQQQQQQQQHHQPPVQAGPGPPHGSVPVGGGSGPSFSSPVLNHQLPQHAGLSINTLGLPAKAPHLTRPNGPFPPELAAQLVQDRLNLQAALAQNASAINNHHMIKKARHLLFPSSEQGSPRYDKWRPSGLTTPGQPTSMPVTAGVGPQAGTAAGPVGPHGEQLVPSLAEIQAALIERERAAAEQNAHCRIFPEELVLHPHPTHPHLDPHGTLRHPLTQQPPFLHPLTHPLPPGLPPGAALLNPHSALPAEALDYLSVDAFGRVAPTLLPHDMLYEISPYQLLGLHPFFAGFRPIRLVSVFVDVCVEWAC